VPGISKELLLKAVEGKAASRLLLSERTPNDEVIIRYAEAQDERQDNLHKQSIRSEVKRLGGEDWKIHILSLGEAGFSVEVRPAPSRAVPEPMQLPQTPVEHHAQVEPGPVVNGEVIDLDDKEQLKEIAIQLQGLAGELAKLSGVAMVVAPFLG
jgi:hypothetical protein